MLTNYTGTNGTIVDSTNKIIAIVGLIVFNPLTTTTTAIIELKDSSGNVKARLLETPLSAKETLFLDCKLFVNNGDTVYATGAEFTLSGNEDGI